MDVYIVFSTTSWMLNQSYRSLFWVIFRWNRIGKRNNKQTEKKKEEKARKQEGTKEAHGNFNVFSLTEESGKWVSNYHF